MKQVVFLAIAVLSLATAFAQAPEIIHDNSGEKILKGFLNEKDLAADTAFAWFAQNQKGYSPYTSTLQSLKANKDSVSFLVFGGTWCHDTQFILPKFFSLSEAAGISQDQITLLGVDRSKKTIQHLSERFNITNVPTIIVLKDGKEIGRVVEYGKSGMFDKDLGEILAARPK
jgi:thiol-disulfide isomerase/thioredoxin